MLMLWGVLLRRNLLAFNCWEAALTLGEGKCVAIQFSVLLLPNYCTTIRHFPPGYFGWREKWRGVRTLLIPSPPSPRGCGETGDESLLRLFVRLFVCIAVQEAV